MSETAKEQIVGGFKEAKIRASHLSVPVTLIDLHQDSTVHGTWIALISGRGSGTRRHGLLMDATWKGAGRWYGTRIMWLGATQRYRNLAS